MNNPLQATCLGTIATVDLQNELLTLKNADAAFFDFQIQQNTSIGLRKQKIKLEELANQTGKEAAVTFQTLRSGNVALKIDVY
jgi:hypothetical protein